MNHPAGLAALATAPDTSRTFAGAAAPGRPR